MDCAIDKSYRRGLEYSQHANSHTQTHVFSVYAQINRLFHAKRPGVNSHNRRGYGFI